MILKDTIDMMNSSEYQQRFKAEYYQLVIRYYRLKEMLEEWELKEMLEEWDNNKIEFTPTCPRSTYNMQLKAMVDYIAVLEARAVMEDIDLDLDI